MRTRARSKPSGKLGLLLTAAPIILELITQARRAQKKRSRFTRARKRDRLIDAVLAQAQRRLGRRGPRRF